MLVRDVMSTQLHCVKTSASFAEVLQILIHHRISGVPVIDHHEKFVGIISEKDLLLNLFPSQAQFYQDYPYYLSHEHIEHEANKINDLTAQDLMTTELITVEPQDHVLKACAVLIIHKIRRLPVVDHEHLVGIVTTNNLYRNYLRYLVGKTKVLTH